MARRMNSDNTILICISQRYVDDYAQITLGSPHTRGSFVQIARETRGKRVRERERVVVCGKFYLFLQIDEYVIL